MAAATILDCLEDLISIKGPCDEIIPSSGMYIDDVGLSLKNLDEFVTEDFLSSYALFQNKRDFSIRILTNQIHQHLSNRYLANTVLEGQRIGHFRDNLQIVTGTAGTHKGINFEFQNFSSYIDFFVSEISIQITNSAAYNIKVYDLIQNKLLDTIPITSVANEIVTVYPHKTYRSNRKKLNIIFVIDAVVDSNTTYVHPDLSGDAGCGSCGPNGGGTFTNSWLWARGISVGAAAQKIKSNLTYSSDTGGLSVVYSLNCNHEQWLCSVAQQIAMPLLYKTCAELIGFAMDSADSERVNTFTFANGDKLQARLDKYEAKYAQSMDNILKSIQLPSDAACFKCNSRNRIKIMIP